MTDAAALPRTPVLLVRTVAVPATEAEQLSDLVAMLPQADPLTALAWVRRGDGLVGWGEAARITTSGPGRFADADAQWAELAAHMVIRDEVNLPGTGAVAFGSFAFSAHSAAGGTLVVPQLVVGRREGTTWITTIAPASHLAPAPRLADLRAAVEPWGEAREVTFTAGALGREQWREQVRGVIGLIREQVAGKVVMARDVHAELDGPLDGRRLLGNLASEYPTCWTFAVDGMVGATPELLVRRERGLLSSRVLAGTIQRTGDDEADLARAASLARSSKDLEEHEFAVDSLTRSLRPYASSTNAPDAPYVLHLPNVMHLASDVTAVLDEAHTAMSSLAVAAALHPTAAVCGTPTEVAAQIIAAHEHMDRARYAAPVGWIGADGDGEWGIALRSAQVDPDARGLRLFAGCGIVAASDPEAELVESEAKLEPMRSALRR